MKREQLKELGLTDEQIGSIMALHGQTVNDLNQRLNTAEGERDSAKEQLSANQTELDTLKESAKGNAELSQQLADLQVKFDESETNSKTVLAEKDKDYAIRLALKDANPLDEEILLGLLDRDTIKVTDSGLQGFTEQLETLKESKSFLFQSAEEAKPPTPQIVVGGNPQAAGATTVTKEQFDKMTFAEQSALAKNQPEVFKQITGGHE